MLFGSLKAKLLQKKLVALLFDKKSGPVIAAIACLKRTDTEFRTAVLSFMLDKEITNDVGVEEIPDDHFSLALAVSIAFFRKGNVYPCVEETG